MELLINKTKLNNMITESKYVAIEIATDKMYDFGFSPDNQLHINGVAVDESLYNIENIEYLIN